MNATASLLCHYKIINRKIVTIQNQDNTILYCPELHSPYEKY